MKGETLTRSFSLPFGFRATFCWRDARLDVEWEPHSPCIKKQRAWRKFFAAYQAARREVYQEIAAITGGSILAIDTDLKTIVDMEVITSRGSRL